MSNIVLEQKPVGFEEWWNRPNRPYAAIALIETDKPAFESIWKAAQDALLASQAASNGKNV